VLGNSVYFGSEDDYLYSLSTRNGNIRWKTQLAGPIKAAPAFRDGVLYVGDYGGDMNAVRASDGTLLWQSGSLGTGFSGGQFYSTPAVAFGRVYAGNNDGRVYSYDQKDGTLAWTHSTGGYVYSGPTVATTPTTPPTVYIGSFDGNVYALNAKNGETRWSRSAGGQVVGSLSAVGNIVYVAEFTNGSTNGYDMRTGRPVFHYKTGTYSPVISDGVEDRPGAARARGQEAGPGAGGAATSTEARAPPPTSAPFSRRRSGTPTSWEARKRVSVKS
jgi:outer membrane protein assembly factor BamB